MPAYGPAGRRPEARFRVSAPRASTHTCRSNSVSGRRKSTTSKLHPIPALLMPTTDPNSATTWPGDPRRLCLRTESAALREHLVQDAAEVVWFRTNSVRVQVRDHGLISTRGRCCGVTDPGAQRWVGPVRREPNSKSAVFAVIDCGGSQSAPSLRASLMTARRTRPQRRGVTSHRPRITSKPPSPAHDPIS